uniref:Venom peptide n=1 Tax=Mesocestoides corti TaxID=53468 RepID=A0A5K3F1G4_MESCO
MRAIIVALLAVLLFTAVSAKNLKARVNAFVEKTEDFFDNNDLGQRWAEFIHTTKEIIKEGRLT